MLTFTEDTVFLLWMVLIQDAHQPDGSLLRAGGHGSCR